jgi:uncharacterized UBP type Zn finger protein
MLQVIYRGLTIGARRWVLFNDDKVAESEQPPLDLGYVYIFKRTAA